MEFQRSKMKIVLVLYVFCFISQGLCGQPGSWYQYQILGGEEDGLACYELEMEPKTHVDFGFFKVDHKLTNVTVNGSWYQDQVFGGEEDQALGGEEDVQAYYELQMETITTVDFGHFKLDYKLSNVTAKFVDKLRHDTEKELETYKKRVATLEMKLIAQDRRAKTLQSLSDGYKSDIQTLNKSLKNQEQDLGELRGNLTAVTNTIEVAIDFDAFVMNTLIPNAKVIAAVALILLLIWMYFFVDICAHVPLQNASLILKSLLCTLFLLSFTNFVLFTFSRMRLAVKRIWLRRT